MVRSRGVEPPRPGGLGHLRPARGAWALQESPALGPRSARLSARTRSSCPHGRGHSAWEHGSAGPMGPHSTYFSANLPREVGRSLLRRSKQYACGLRHYARGTDGWFGACRARARVHRSATRIRPRRAWPWVRSSRPTCSRCCRRWSTCSARSFQRSDRCRP